MDEIQRKDNKEISKYLKIICGKTMQALLDSYMFMFPAAYKYDNKDTFMFRYSYYAFRQKAILSVKKLIEPAKTDKITLQYLVQLLTQSDISILSEQGKVALKADYDTLFSSEHALRIKNSEMRSVIIYQIAMKRCVTTKTSCMLLTEVFIY